jgi:hypothetical protein
LFIIGVVWVGVWWGLWGVFMGLGVFGVYTEPLGALVCPLPPPPPPPISSGAYQIKEAERQHQEDLAQAEHHHQTELLLQRKMLLEEMTTEIRQHKEGMNLAETHHLETLFQEHFQHDQDMDLQAISFQRENARDVWAAKGRKLEALFVMTTLMFACFIALLCEGMPPPAYEATSGADPNRTLWGEHAIKIGLDGPLMVVWAGVAALSGGGLVATLYLLIWTHEKMNAYNIYNPKQQYVNLTFKFEKVRNKQGEIINEAKGEEPKGNEFAMYEEYYEKKCKRMTRLAQRLFHYSTYSTVLLASLTLASRLVVQYHSETGAVVFLSIVCLILAVLVRTAPSSCHSTTPLLPATNHRMARLQLIPQHQP